MSCAWTEAERLMTVLLVGLVVGVGVGWLTAPLIATAVVMNGAFGKGDTDEDAEADDE